MRKHRANDSVVDVAPSNDEVAASLFVHSNHYPVMFCNRKGRLTDATTSSIGLPINSARDAHFDKTSSIVSDTSKNLLSRSRITVFDVADWFLIHSPNVNNKKLQKLVYYAYAWFLTLNNESPRNIQNRLFDNHFEAWIHGAVCPDLYYRYNKFGSKNIPKPKNTDRFNNFSESEIDILEQVNEVYGNYNGNELESICHQESPWKNARGKLRPNLPSTNRIKDEDIFNCYAARL